MGELDLEKRRLRAEAKQRLAELSAVEREAHASAIVEHVVSSALWRESRDLLAYLSIEGEVDLDGLWAVSGRPALWAPKVAGTGHGMSAAVVEDPGALPRGRFGVRVPVESSLAMEPGGFGVVLVPGLVFDRYGGRLGRGAGFYDRWLSRNVSGRTAVVGVCFEAQLADRVPMDRHDVRMTMLVTETGLRAVSDG